MATPQGYTSYLPKSVVFTSGIGTPHLTAISRNELTSSAISESLTSEEGTPRKLVGRSPVNFSPSGDRMTPVPVGASPNTKSTPSHEESPYNGSSRRKRFTAQEKITILKFLEESNNLRATARKFNVDRKTIRSWMEHREELEHWNDHANGVHSFHSDPRGGDRTPLIKKRKTLSPGEKLEIIKEADSETVRQVAKKHGVDPKSVRYWQRQRNELEEQSKTGTVPKAIQVLPLPNEYEQNLGTWLHGEEAKGIFVTYAMIVEKLKELTRDTVYNNFNPTDSWLLRFKKKFSSKGNDAGVMYGEPQNFALTTVESIPVVYARAEDRSPSTQVHHIDPDQLKFITIFNTLRELLTCKAELGRVAMCEGTPRFYVSTKHGWVKAELAPECHPPNNSKPSIASINFQLYKNPELIN